MEIEHTLAGAEIGWRATETLHRYCRAIDHHDAAALSSVFSPDAALIVAGHTGDGGDGAEQRFEGRELVVSLLASLFEQRRWARHMVSNVLVEVGATGEIRVESYFQFVLGRDETRTRGVGDYRATMRDFDGRLLITSFSASIIDEATVPVGEAG